MDCYPLVTSETLENGARIEIKHYQISVARGTNFK